VGHEGGKFSRLGSGGLARFSLSDGDVLITWTRKKVLDLFPSPIIIDSAWKIAIDKHMDVTEGMGS